MKTKLQLLILAILFSVSYAHAQKTDVWDFGGATLDVNLYNNKLTSNDINAWYAVAAGTEGTNLPSSVVLTLTSGVLTLKTGNGDRLYTTNEAITRTATGNLGTTDKEYTARYYCNGAASSTTRFFTLKLNEDDEVTVVASTETLSYPLVVTNTTTNTQSESLPVVASGTAVSLAKFVAKQAGDFKITCLAGKGNYYRIYRKPASYAAITGNLDIAQAPGIPAGYSIVFTSTTGKSWTAPVTSGTYSVNLPKGFTYKMSLLNANGFVISNGDYLAVSDATTTYDIAVLKVDLFTVTGNVTGLGTDLSKVALVYTANPAANKTYVPKPVINTATGAYSVDLEANVPYTISGTGVNNYEILSNSITASAASTADVVFSPKPVYGITINTTGLDAAQIDKLKLTFTNLNESGYVYNFNSPSGITLRNGTYSLVYSGLDDYPVDLGLVSNVTVNGVATSKALDFKPVSNWSFDDKVISTTTTASYKGMIFNGTVSNEIAKGHILVKPAATIKVPVKVGDKITVTYYYAADFSIDGGAAITTASNSTNIFENVEYTYTGATDGFVTITAGSGTATTYITNVAIGGSIAYAPVLTVGTDKTYKTINSALEAVAKMTRTTTDRVTIMVDPGNYEEMLVISQPNVTLKNAASTPSIALSNKGVDIDANAVRVTSYYGHGYSYYSMSSDQKWHADVLKVNKENGYLSYANAGSGTTNGSYWNATVVVSANGFEANDIIFENSYNQYISKKESEDVVVEWAVGGKGTRPTNIGNTTVQNRSFVERAAAISIVNNVDKVVLNKCRVIGRQDSFYGGTGARVVVYKGVMMGAVDYIFGGMNAVFYKTDFAMNTSDVGSDQAYITAAQQAAGRGYLMYECKVTTAIPGIETASLYRAKPGYFGRPWAAATSEVVFYNTTIETSNFPASENLSLIVPAGWNDTLSGQSAKMYEYGTIEQSGVNNQASRASWATTLSTVTGKTAAVPTLTDGTAITTFNFTKGSDGWDPLPQLISNDNLGVKYNTPTSAVNVVAYKNRIAISNVKSETAVAIYTITGAKVKTFKTAQDVDFEFQNGIWIVFVKAEDGLKSVKVITH
ncbi:pectinesterase family protein [Flavobacterium sp. W22_SRS_FK3]|uniref:pectinesterase family protein n=1 Tax=Flavobacterium sp. W22_SRS_FK3 TaxID=3240275 RepID=UPI003F8F313F